MRKDKSFLQQLLDQSDLAEENIPGKPIVELLGDCRILVENHRGITEYGLERICIKVCYGIVQVTGCNLRLRQVTNRKLLITGKIQGLDILRGDVS